MGEKGFDDALGGLGDAEMDHNPTMDGELEGKEKSEAQKKLEKENMLEGSLAAEREARNKKNIGPRSEG